jgi:hypothetical protein
VVAANTGSVRRTAKITAGGATLTITQEPAVSAAPAISINFMGTHTVPMDATETAGVIAKAYWNNASGASRSTPLSLVNENGVAAGAITWTANAWKLPITDQAGNRRMMKGYLDTTSSSTTTVTVSGLTQRAYDIYVYADGDNTSYARTAAYTISGPGIVTTRITLTDPANTNFSTTFTRAINSSGNYVKFSINATGFTLTATPVSGDNATLRAPINGIQIIP